MDLPNSSFDSQSTLSVADTEVQFASMDTDKLHAIGDVRSLPKSLKVLLENLLRNEDGQTVTAEDIEAIVKSDGGGADQEIAFRPARVLMQDFTGVPAVVDLAAMRAALAARDVDPEKINPVSAVDLVIDHSVSIDQFASPDAFAFNVKREMQRNFERYQFLKWGQNAFDNFRVVPPGTGICHQVNLEYLAKVVWRDDRGESPMVYPDTLVGTDSHTTMVNALGVLGWGVGGIEAEAALLGQPISMLIPQVVGFEFKGSLREGVTATDLVLRVVEMLRKHGVVSKFVEFYGDGLDQLTLSDRATIANMSPEYGATCGFFPVDQQTMTYLKLTGRSEDQIELVERYCKLQGLWREAGDAPNFASTLQLDLDEVVPSLAGPKRPQDRVDLPAIKKEMIKYIDHAGQGEAIEREFAVEGADTGMHHGDVVVAAITSCTNTSNPAVMLAAGLLAKNAVERGLGRKHWVKTSLAPGSKVVTDYLDQTGLQSYLNQLGFDLVGYGCTTCIGNSGPLAPDIDQAVRENELIVASVLSGNRNFEGRIHPLVQANWLASPPLVVAFALAGTTLIDLDSEPLGQNDAGEDIFLKDIWPSAASIEKAMLSVDESMFRERYADVFDGDQTWQDVEINKDPTYAFAEDSTYIRLPTFFEERYLAGKDKSVEGARLLALLGDSVTTDHISPAGSIASESPAADYLREHGVEQREFNSYGSRRGNHEVMMRGTFGNIRISNELVEGVTGGFTRRFDSDSVETIYDVAMDYMKEGIPAVVIGGKEYGTGSSRDWAAKGSLLLGVKAVVVESFERIHRSNLVGMGVLPLQFPEGVTRKTLDIKGDEHFDFSAVDSNNGHRKPVTMSIHRSDGTTDTVDLICRIDTDMELAYFMSGGILPYVMNQLAKSG